MFSMLKGLYYLSPLAYIFHPDHFRVAWKLIYEDEETLKSIAK